MSSVMKVFANPFKLRIEDQTYDLKLNVRFYVDGDGDPYAHFEVVSDEDIPGEEEIIACFDLDMSTLETMVDEGWYYGESPPEEWGEDPTQEVPPGTTLH